MTKTVLNHPYVFIVLELTNDTGIIHGVYANKCEAEGKRDKLMDLPGQHIEDYICVLKKAIQGKKPKIITEIKSKYNLGKINIVVKE